MKRTGLLSVAQAATELQIAGALVVALCEVGHLSSVRVRGAWLIRASAVAEIRARRIDAERLSALVRAPGPARP